MSRGRVDGALGVEPTLGVVQMGCGLLDVCPAASGWAACADQLVRGKCGNWRSAGIVWFEVDDAIFDYLIGHSSDCRDECVHPGGAA